MLLFSFLFKRFSFVSTSGHEKAYWSKHRKSICDELEPISIVDDNAEEDLDQLRASIILSKTPSDSSLSVSSASSSSSEENYEKVSILQTFYVQAAFS
jgi:hypothetical protein